MGSLVLALGSPYGRGPPALLASCEVRRSGISRWEQPQQRQLEIGQGAFVRPVPVGLMSPRGESLERGAQMKNVILRAVVASMVAIAILGVGPTAASAHPVVEGDFLYEDGSAGSGVIANPTPGVCYEVETQALSGANQTNVDATVYDDASCSQNGVPVGPGSQVASPFMSVRFSSP